MAKFRAIERLFTSSILVFTLSPKISCRGSFFSLVETGLQFTLWLDMYYWVQICILQQFLWIKVFEKNCHWFLGSPWPWGNHSCLLSCRSEFNPPSSSIFFCLFNNYYSPDNFSEVKTMQKNVETEAQIIFTLFL